MNKKKVYYSYSFLFCILYIQNSFGISSDVANLSGEFFLHKGVRYVCYFSCESYFENSQLTKSYIDLNLRVAVKVIDRDDDIQSDVERFLRQWDVPVGVLVDTACNDTKRVMDEASDEYKRLYDASHVWIVMTEWEEDNNTRHLIEDTFGSLNLSVDADVTVVVKDGSNYKLIDIFNFGKIQGNKLETNVSGTWNRENGLNITLDGFKYYHRWDFHNLTFRAVTVVLNAPRVYDQSMLTDVRYTPGASVMTKIAAILLDILKRQHNFRFNITVTGLWIGEPERNSTLAVTNTLFWHEQDISYTSCRIFLKWMQWMEPFLVPMTKLETKFYYLIPDPGVGPYENRFLTPLSLGVWGCACGAALLCGLVLAGAATLQGHPQPGLFALFSILAATCQQAYDDGVQMLRSGFFSQGRRLTLLVVCLTSMVMYNYYTSSVVSWLLSAATPTISSLDGLLNSDLELVFEDIGYTRGWLNNPGFFYYSGIKNPKEDILREKKVLNAKRTVPLLQSVKDGIKLVRTGEYAFHSEPYTASQEISRTFSEHELCTLGALQMMVPSHVYVMGQKRSPYKQFFAWSLLRALERGHRSMWLSRVVGGAPRCSGRAPRALALGQAAPAFALLAVGAAAASVLLCGEIFWYRLQNNHGNDWRRRFKA